MQGCRGPQAGHSFELVATLSMCASPTRGGLAAQGRRYFSLEMFPCWKNAVFNRGIPHPGVCGRRGLCPWDVSPSILADKRDPRLGKAQEDGWPSRLLGG